MLPTNSSQPLRSPSCPRTGCERQSGWPSALGVNVLRKHCPSKLTYLGRDCWLASHVRPKQKRLIGPRPTWVLGFKTHVAVIMTSLLRRLLSVRYPHYPTFSRPPGKGPPVAFLCLSYR